MGDIPELVLRRMKGLGFAESEARSLLFRERRMVSGARIERDAVVEIRCADGEMHTEKTQLGTRGFAAVFDQPSERLHGFMVERMKRGAFKDVLRDTKNLDTHYLVNHEGLAFARTKNGTLELSEKPEGLYHVARFNENDPEAVSLDAKVERGDVDKMSFAFTVRKDEWRYCDHVDDVEYMGCDCTWERDVLRVGSLPDVSVVTYPAYPQTSVTVARESEQGERGAQAEDTEQRAEVGPEAASQNVAGDPANKRRRRARALDTRRPA